MYNPNSPSNWSWSKAFSEMENYINKSEIELQITNHQHNYDGGVKLFTELNKDQKDLHYEILNQIL
jgi:hypothetical protein